MTQQNNAFNLKAILAITLVHFTGDFYNSFVSPLFPVFIEKLHLTLAQVGIIAAVNRFLAFIVQPSIGYLADRYQSRVFIIGGLLLSTVFIPLAGIAPSYGILMICIALGSIGSSMFHPSVAGMVPLYAGDKVGFSMSLFNTGGTFAFAVGPVFITAYVAAYGLGAMPATMIIGFLVIIFLAYAVPIPQAEGLRSLGFWGAIKEALGSVWKSILLIMVIMVLRAVVSQAFLTFMPVLYVQRGYPLTSAGLMFALFTVSGTFSGILSGILSDRIGYKPIFYITHAAMTPALILLLYLQGSWVYFGAALAGCFTLATLPLGVAMAQQLAPHGRSMVASLMMGLALGVGGIITPLIGKLSDIFSIHAVLLIVTFVPLLTLGGIYCLPEIRFSKAK